MLCAHSSLGTKGGRGSWELHQLIGEWGNPPRPAGSPGRPAPHTLLGTGVWVGHRCGPVRTLTLCRVTVPAGRGQIQAPPGTRTQPHPRVLSKSPDSPDLLGRGWQRTTSPTPSPHVEPWLRDPQAPLRGPTPCNPPEPRPPAEELSVASFSWRPGPTSQRPPLPPWCVQPGRCGQPQQARFGHRPA